MKVVFSFIICVFCFNFVGAQEKNNLEPFSRVWSIDTIKNGGELDVKLSPISKEKFESYKNKASTIVRYINPKKNTTSVIHTHNSAFPLKNFEDSHTPYSYGGFNSHIQCHLVYYCKEICEEFFIDHFTDQMFFIPTGYDQGIIGMPFSPQGTRWLVYSSYDGPDYGDYYDYRSEIIFYQITPNQGIKGIKYWGEFISEQWSIEEVHWVSEDSIVLKLYDEPRTGDGTHLNFKYFISHLGE